ncbi:retrovirus-related pol polyprotein from transposon TNT 1-94 [Tanacetum coccineum]
MPTTYHSSSTYDCSPPPRPIPAPHVLQPPTVLVLVEFPFFMFSPGFPFGLGGRLQVSALAYSLELRWLCHGKANESSSKPIPEINSDSESKCKTHEPLPPLPKLIGAAPAGTSNSLISLADLTLNMANLTLNLSDPKKTKPAYDKVSPTYVIKKKTKTMSPAVHVPQLEKKADLSVEQLLLTLIDEVKSLKEQIKVPSDNSLSVSQTGSSKSSKGKKTTCPSKSVNIVDSMTIILIIVNTTLGVKYVVLLLMNQLTVLKGTPTARNQGLEYLKREPYSTKIMKLFSLLLEEEMSMLSFNEEINACFFAKASPSVNWLWHKRLSHLNFKNINKLAKQNLVAGLPSLTFYKDKNCSACEKEKHHRASFKTKKSFFINKCLHLLHMDLFRPIKLQTISHNKYTLVIVDEYSRYTWVFCLKKKSDAAGCIMSFIRKMENLNEVRVKELRIDNGTEFRNHKLEEFYDENGIQHQKTINGRTYHVTFSKDDEAISKSSTEGDAINFNENRSFFDDEFLKPRSKVTQCSGNIEYFPYIPVYETIPEDNITPTDLPILQESVSPEEPPWFTSADDHPTSNELDHPEPTDNLEPANV